MNTPKSEILPFLISSGLLPEYIPTSMAVKLLNHRGYHRNKLYTDHYRQLLGGKRVGAGKLFHFKTIKVLELRENLKKKAS